MDDEHRNNYRVPDLRLPDINQIFDLTVGTVGAQQLVRGLEADFDGGHLGFEHVTIRRPQLHGAQTWIIGRNIR